MHPGLDLLLALVAAILFVAPTVYQLVDDRRAQSTRSFSLVPCKIRHAIACVLRLGIIVAAFLATQRWGFDSEPVWLVSGGLLLATLLIARSDKRLRIDADTGLVRWTKMSNPLSGRRKVLFVDELEPLDFERGKRELRKYIAYAFDLWTLGFLRLTYSVDYNGGTQVGGVFSEDTVRELCKRVNAYLEAFRRHDTDERRQERRRFREEYERAHASGLSGKEERASREAQREREAAEREAQRRAEAQAEAQRAEEERRERLEDKFR